MSLQCPIQLEESLEKKVLVLGLERSGKSTLVSQIVNEVGPNSFTSNTLYKPTEGFHVTSLSDGASPPVNIWESKTIVILFIIYFNRYLLFILKKNIIKDCSSSLLNLYEVASFAVLILLA